MPPYVYVKIIWRITSYSTLFILKRKTGNCFYLLSYVRLSGIFLEKVRKKTPFRTTLTCHFLFGCRYTNGYPLTNPPPHWEWRGTAYRLEARLIEFTVNRSPDNRGSIVLIYNTWNIQCRSDNSLVEKKSTNYRLYAVSRFWKTITEWIGDLY
jgi:hypothetical protein